MQEALNSAIRQLQHSQEDVVDRALVANLIVQYFSKGRSREMLQILSKILNFSDNQLVAVGLKVAPTTIIDSFMSALAPKVENVEIEVLIIALLSIDYCDLVQGDNLAELWVNYLLEETQNDNETTHGKTPKKSR